MAYKIRYIFYFTYTFYYLAYTFYHLERTFIQIPLKLVKKWLKYVTLIVSYVIYGKQRNSHSDISCFGWKLHWRSLRKMPLISPSQIHAHTEEVLETTNTALLWLIFGSILTIINQNKILWKLILIIYL